MSEKTEKIELTLDLEICAKVMSLCRKRGLRFPQDINILLQEVAQPDAKKARTKRAAKSKK